MTSELEDMLDPVRSKHEDWFDTLWVEHEPAFRLIIRVARVTTLEEMCALFVGWPVEVAVEPAAAGYTFADVEAGAEVLNQRWREDGSWEDKTFPFIEVGPDPVSNSVRVAGPKRPADAYLNELSALAGVPVTWSFMAEPDFSMPGKPPECINPTVMCR